MHIKEFFRDTIKNFPGWSINRKIVVFESDDWGSIRMPSKQVYEKCLRKGYPVNLNPYERYDSLASEDDLVLLFDLLAGFKDSVGRNPIITANCVVANPDFHKIREDSFRNYHFELITKTFQHYPKHKNNFSLWDEGKEKMIFYPQFHAREHLNVSKFLNALQSKDKDVLFGFENKMPGCIRKGTNYNGNYFVEATLYNSKEDKDEKLSMYLDGLELFSKLFNYNSLSIIPTNYTWSRDFDQAVLTHGVKYIQGLRKMREPALNGKYVFYTRKIGEFNRFGQIALVRNVTFEPTLTNYTNQVEMTLRQISNAFRMKKPAIISSHRVNFVGFIDERNRDKNLIMLKELIRRIVKTWPDVEFLSSNELGDIISKSR